MGGEISRRTALLAGAASVAAVSLPVAKAAGAGYDPRSNAEGQVKLGAMLDGSPAYWLYFGTVYAVLPGQHPKALVAVSGCQSSWADRQDDGSYLMTGATLTYFRDLKTGAIIDQFDNPITGQQNQVKANFLSGGALRFPADGSSAFAERLPPKGGVVAASGYGAADKRPLGFVRWTVLSQSIMLQTDRDWNTPKQPQTEAETQSCDKAVFFDPAIRRMPARGSSTTIIPWMTWMDMGATEGHLVWHTSSEKDFSLDGITPDYRAKAGDLMDRLAAKPTKI